MTLQTVMWLIFRSLMMAFVAFLSISCGSRDSLANVPEHAIRMYHQEPFIEEQKKFFPFDTIYAVVDLANMQPGEYTLNIEWIQPNGQLARNATHPFTLDKAVESYRIFFWLKLHEKGPLKQILSGQEFAPVVYGNWQVKVSCNDNALSTAEFVISDNIR